MCYIPIFFFKSFILSVLLKITICSTARVDLREHDLSHISSEQLRRVITQDENQNSDLTTDNESLLEKLNNQTMYQQESNGSRCSSCIKRDDQRKHRIESIKNRISHALRLDILGMPNVTNTKLPKIPQFQRLKQRSELREELNMQSDDYRSSQQDYEDEFGQSEKSFIFSKNLTTGNDQPNAIHFDLPDLTDKVLEECYLWVYTNPLADTNVKKIFVYKLDANKDSRGFPVREYFHAKKRSSRGWQRIRIIAAVEKWLEDPSSNLGLVVEALDRNGSNLVVMPSNDDDGYRPNLEIKTSLHRHHRRSKRSIYLNCSERNNSESACCRYPLIVDFVEFGWDFIIAPLRYSAYYCAGDCRNQHIDSGAHSHLVQQSTALRPEHGPCCSPTRMGQLSMLYFDHSMNIQFTTLPRMKVERCACA